MERVIFVEILDRRGRVRERVRLDSFPATIGRAYTNSIIIDDKHICPEHVRITLDENGTLTADDLGSVNGMYQENSRRHSQRITIDPDAIIRIGQTVLRFRGPDHGVPPAIADKIALSDPPKFLMNAYAALALFFLSIAVLLLNKFLGSSDEFTFNKVLESLFVILLLFAVWAGIWSFVNRLTTHQFRFLSHAGLAGGGVAIVILMKTASEYYAFIYSPGISDDAIELVIMGFACFLLLFGHLTILSGVSLIKRLSASLLIAIGLFGGIGFHTYIDSKKFSSAITIHYQLKPLDTKRLHPVSTETFFNNVQTLKQELEKAAAKE